MVAPLCSKGKAEVFGILRDGLPLPSRQFWYKTDELQAMLKAGGLPNLPEKAVTNALRGRTTTVATNNWDKKNWYCFETNPDRQRFDAPKAQMKGLKRELGGEAELQTNFFVRDERREAINAIPSNHFANCCELQHLQQYAEAVGPSPEDDPARETRDDTTPRRVATDPARETARVTPSSAGKGARIATPAPSRPVVVQQATFGRGLSAAAARFGAPTPAPTKEKWRGSNKVQLPIDVPDGQHVGLVFSAIGKTTECVRIAEEHARRCPGNCKLQLTERVKSGFDLIETYGCGFCKEEHKIQSGPKADPTATRRQGGQESETSKIIAHSAHASAVNVSQLGEFLDQAGCVRAGNTGLHKMYERRKAAVRSVCNDQLRQNRIEHVAAVRAKQGAECDVEHKDAEDRVHKICSGAVSYDGAGETRAYNHRITGSQHVTVLYSMETGKPLMVWHDQLSCGHCSRIITKLIVEGGKRAHGWMGEEGQKRVYKEITSRLNECNIDRVARAMSSNNCENFFGVLAKYSHGKRINNGQTDSWAVYQLLVAGQRSDDRIEDKIQSHACIQSSHVRDTATAKQVKKKEYERARKQTSEYKQRRKMSQLAKVRKAAQNTTASAKHKPNKLAPTASCKSKAAKPANNKKKRKRRSKCKNCQQFHEGPCEDPQYPDAEGSKKKTKQQKKEEEEQDELLAMARELYGS